MEWIPTLTAVLGTVLALVVLDRLACWLESHGFIRWRGAKTGAGAASALGEFASMLEPQRPTIEFRARALELAEDDDEKASDDPDLPAGLVGPPRARRFPQAQPEHPPD